MKYRAVIEFEFDTTDIPAERLRAFSELLTLYPPMLTNNVKITKEVIEELDYKDVDISDLITIDEE